MNLSALFCSIQNVLTVAGWESVIEDDYPDLKLLVCENQSGPFEAFSRLDVLIMTPEFDPAEASGVCICFLFYADPTKVVNMLKLGKMIRHNNFHLFQAQCESILHNAGINLGNPSIKLLTRPKFEKVRFSNGSYSYPAFIVEVDYWLSCEKYLPGDKDFKEEASFLKDESVIDARIEAIYALRGSDLHETEELLLNAVADPNPAVRKAGLNVLLEYFDEKYLPLIQEALHDDDDEIRKIAGEQLKLFRKFRDGTLRINSKPSVQDCLKALECKNDFIREQAVEALVGVTESQIVQPLVAVMKSDNETSRCRSATVDALELFDCHELLNEFYSVLGDECVGDKAAYALARKSDPIAHELLYKAFFSDDRTAKLFAARCVRCGDGRVLQELCHMLEDHDPTYRSVAIERISSWIFLGEQEPLGHSDISEESTVLLIAALKAAATDENEEIRMKAIESLCLIDKTQGAPLLKDALEGYIQFVLDKNYQGKKYDWFQTSLHYSITILGDKSFCEPLIRLFKSNCWDVKLEAASTLLNLGDNRALGVLEGALNHADWNVRTAAAEILFQHGDKRMWDVLIKRLHENAEGHPYWKMGIIDMLAKSGDPRTVDVFCELLNDTTAYNLDDMDIGRIITNLGEIGDPRALEPIRRWQYEELVNCDGDLVEKVLKVLTERANREILKNSLKDG